MTHVPMLTFYTRNGCHLCDHAKETLSELQAEYKFNLIEVNIETSDELTEQYGLMIPVIDLDGEEVCFGYVDEIGIRNRLQEKM